jgi:hypothetical protein
MRNRNFLQNLQYDCPTLVTMKTLLFGDVTSNLVSFLPPSSREKFF